MEEVLQIVIFQIGTGHFGMEINWVRGVAEHVQMTEAFNMYASNMRGLLHLGGDVVPVLNVCEYLHVEPLAFCKDIPFLLFQKQERMVAFPVDKVEKYCGVSRQCLSTIPVIAQNPIDGCFRWIANIEGRLVPILDAEWLMERVGI